MAGTITLFGVPLPEEPDWSSRRGQNKELAKTVGKIRQGGLGLDGAAALTGRSMDALYGLDIKRRALAGNDPGLNAAMAELEMAFVQKAKGIIGGVDR
ncbi:MAG: hypothetical protein QOH56_392 [Pseudonocardiales bacterium]|jgi:hypothetical protein|nr:hypothetical protein [Pseudonocardiales bacterium]